MGSALRSIYVQGGSVTLLQLESASLSLVVRVVSLFRWRLSEKTVFVLLTFGPASSILQLPQSNSLVYIDNGASRDVLPGHWGA